MRLPDGENAVVPTAKLLRYLLDVEHPVGRPKARFFRSLGYRRSYGELLADALRTIARTQEVVESCDTPFGRKFVVDGTLHAPNGVIAHIRTVWIMVEGELPRFVTAYPVRRR